MLGALDEEIYCVVPWAKAILSSHTIDPAQKKCIGFPPLRQEKGAKTGHGVAILQSRINRVNDLTRD
jgi:hypothetical protein